ncbi:50S ribosomal protein P1 [Candidatus Micrarchaeota archaeon]|nr:50S ribosomal protein P1 [Candidatus Micrarchaeota archaeon]MBU2476864.1 50S ribosomal protein P1 [Candidatus Micrarchaeota archaeon]
MEYVYAAMLLHSAKKEISEKAVTEVLKAAGIDVDSGRVKALVASLKDVNIEEAIKSASVMPAAAVTPQGEAKAEKKEEKEEDEGKSEEEAAAGLGALFG